MKLKTLVLCCSLLLAACQQFQGRQMSDDEAKKVLEEMKGPDVPSIEQALAKSAEQAMQSGNFTNASQFYRQLVDKHQDNMQYRLRFAEALRRAGQFEPAIQQYDVVLKGNPRDLDAQEGRGLALMGKGDFVEAGRAFDAIIAADSKRWRTLNAAGILFAMKSLMNESMAYFEHALRASPNNPSVLNNVGLALAIDRQYDKAILALRKAMQVASPEGREKQQLAMNLALVYGISGNLEAAEQTAKPYLSEAALYNNMGYYAHLSKDDALAKTYLNMALTKSPIYYQRAWDNLDALAQQSSPASGKERKLQTIVKESPAGRIDEKLFE